MSIQASNRAAATETELSVTVAPGLATDRQALVDQSTAPTRQHFGDQMPPALAGELRPSYSLVSAVAEAVDGLIRADARDFILAKMAERGLGPTDPSIAGAIRTQYSGELVVTRLAA